MGSVGRFDVVFCRYVLGRFDHPDLRKKTLAGITEQLTNDGFLCLGLDETTERLSGRLQPVPVARGLYGLYESMADDTRMAS